MEGLQEVLYPKNTPKNYNENGKDSRKPKITVSGNLSKTEARREYQRRYYQTHKEQAKEYQRQYNLTHKKKQTSRLGRGREASFNAPRQVIKTTFNTNDLMHAPVEKTIRMLEKIINGERFFTM